MSEIRGILSSASISEADAAALLSAYPGIGEALAGTAAKLERTHRKVEIRPFTAEEIVRYWSAPLDKVMVGLVNYEASGMTQFGRTALYIEKRTGHLVTDEW